MFLFNDTLNTFIYSYMEGRKCFYLTTHSTHLVMGIWKEGKKGFG